MSKYWLDYVKHCYDLVIETEGQAGLVLDHEIEAYIVHLMARNFERTDIGKCAVAIQFLQAMSTKRTERLLKLTEVADECLLIHSYPLRRTKWPTDTYYQDMGITAYGLAAHAMEHNFIRAGKVLTAIFNTKN